MKIPLSKVSIFSLFMVCCSGNWINAATYTVTDTTTDPADGKSLDWALAQAEQNPGVDNIHFNIPGNGPHSIGGFRSINSPVVIDGYTQGNRFQIGAAASPNTLAVGNNAVIKIIMNQTFVSATFNGFQLNSSNITVRGLAFIGSREYGIFGTDNVANACVIEGCFIGINPAGVDLWGFQNNNVKGGIYWGGISGRIGGPNPDQRNIISGNQGSGIVINGSDNDVQNNYIGTDRDGLKRLGNLKNGIDVIGNNNRIGGSDPNFRNIISGNFGEGMEIISVDNKVQGNFIGTDANGMISPGNGLGDPARDPFNQGLGNDGQGVAISGGGNNDIGESFDRNTGSIIPPSSGHAGNLIAGNFEDGVFVLGGVDPNNPTQTLFGFANAILGNSIYSNEPVIPIQPDTDTAIAIDLWPPDGQINGVDNKGITPNDPGDADGGGNKLQNFPIIGISQQGTNQGDINIAGTATGTNGSQLLIEFYSNHFCDDAGNGELRFLIGRHTMNIGVPGNNPFDVTFSSPVRILNGHHISATATDSGGNTSEPSPCFQHTGGTILGQTIGPIPSSPIGKQGFDIIITWTGPSGAVQHLEHSTDHITWQMIGPVFTIPSPPVSQIHSYTHTQALFSPRNFYRIRTF